MNKKILLILIITLLLSSCSIDSKPRKETNFLIGTFVSITVFDNYSDKLFDEIFNRIKDIENKMSIKQISSEVIDINKNAGITKVNVSHDTIEVLKKAQYYSNLSNGSFDISIGPIEKLWAIGSENEGIPSITDIENSLPLVNYKNILIDEKNLTVKLLKENIIIDLGGIAKGFAADEVVKILKSYNVKSAIIDLGGNIFAYGHKNNSENWKIGIQNPFDNRNEYLGIVDVNNKSVVSSGTYERFFKENGKIYHHILNPKTGYPIENSLIGINIISDKSIDGDALSTTIFSLGLEKGLEVINGIDNTEAIFITKDKKVYLSKNINTNFTLTNNNFIIKRAK